MSRRGSASLEDGVVDEGEGVVSIFDQIKSESEKRRKEERDQEVVPRMPTLKKEFTLPIRTTEKWTFQRPVQLKWRNINLTIKQRKMPARRILQNVSGFVNPGEIFAIMGPSGCGKTSLMTILAGRNKTNPWTGEIVINEQPANPHFFKSNVGYVEQDDCFLPLLTVKEQFTYAAYLRLARDLPDEERNLIVDKMIKDLGLTNAANTPIGNQTIRGVSGGERKRTNIGVEMLSDPCILFLDEPTSGLDAFTSQKLMNQLRTLADEGRTIVLSIHQPRVEIFMMLDRIMLMSAGEVVYFGPGGQDAVDFFIREGVEFNDLSNPADVILDVVTAENPERLACAYEPLERMNSFSKIQQRAASLIYGEDVIKEGKPALVSKVTQLIHAHKRSGYDNPSNFPHAPEVCKKLNPDSLVFERATYSQQFKLLFRRACQNFYRSKVSTVVRFAIAIIMGIVAGTIFLHTKFTSTGLADKTGAIFTVMLGCSVSVANNVVTSFPAERAVFLREYRSGSYHSSPYYLSKILAEIPMQIVVPIVYGTLLYWLADLNPDVGRFFSYLLILVTLTLLATGLGLCISCAVESAYLASVLVSPVIVLFLFLAGFLRTDANLPPFWSQLKYISFFRYSYFMLVCNEFQDEGFDGCTNCIAPNGNAYLSDDLHYDCSEKWPYYGILIAFYVFFTTMGYVFLHRRAQK